MVLQFYGVCLSAALFSGRRLYGTDCCFFGGSDLWLCGVDGKGIEATVFKGQAGAVDMDRGFDTPFCNAFLLDIGGPIPLCQLSVR